MGPDMGIDISELLPDECTYITRPNVEISAKL